MQINAGGGGANTDTIVEVRLLKVDHISTVTIPGVDVAIVGGAKDVLGSKPATLIGDRTTLMTNQLAFNTVLICVENKYGSIVVSSKQTGCIWTKCYTWN